MQPIIGRIEQLTNRTSPPSGGSGVPDKPYFDLSKLDEAQQKADKLKATLLEIQELTANLNMSAELLIDLKIADAKKQILDEITNAVEKAVIYQSKF